ncbi:ABC transporter transmembrane domain-containing protein, partial [Paracidovorax cattleyae]
ATAEAWGGRRVFAASRRCISQLREQACAALAGRSPLDRGRPASGLAANAVAEQADALLPWLLRYETARWRVMAVPPVMALAVAGVSWAAALILVAAAPLIPAAMALIGWRAQAASAEQLQALGGMNGFLLDRLRGLSTLRALGAVDATALRLRASAEDLRQRTMRVLRIAFLSSASLELFSALAVAFVAVYVGFHLLGQIGMGSWGRPLGLGQGLFILLLAPAFFEPLRDLSAAWHDRAAGRAALEALAAL